MVGTAIAAAKAAHQEDKPMLYVECCTNQPEPSPRIVSADSSNLYLSTGSNSSIVTSSWPTELKNGSENIMLHLQSM